MSPKYIKSLALGAAVEEEAIRRGDVEHKCWMVVDLGDGDVAGLVWFGSTEQMTELLRVLKTLPEIGFGFLAKNADADTLEAGLHVNGEEPVCSDLLAALPEAGLRVHGEQAVGALTKNVRKAPTRKVAP